MCRERPLSWHSPTPYWPLQTLSIFQLSAPYCLFSNEFSFLVTKWLLWLLHIPAHIKSSVGNSMSLPLEVQAKFTLSVLRCLVCPTLCDPIDCSPPGSSVHGNLLARILEWVAISYSRGSSQPKDRTHSLASSALAGGFFILSAAWEAQNPRWVSLTVVGTGSITQQVTVVKRTMRCCWLLSAHSSMLQCLYSCCRNETPDVPHGSTCGSPEWNSKVKKFWADESSSSRL